MIIYTVFDPDDGSGTTYWWYGDVMVYVHQHGKEIDAFELDGTPPVIESVRAAVEVHHGGGPMSR